MNQRMSSLLISLTITIILLTVLEIISTTVIPAIGLRNFILPFNVLFILFLGFRVSTSALPVLVLVVQLFHSVFSVEGWAHGTFTGIIICVAISFLSDIIDFTSALSTMVITFISLLVWFIFTSILFYMSSQDLDFVLNRIFDSIPECVVLSVLSPFFFVLLDRIWRVDRLRGVEA